MFCRNCGTELKPSDNFCLNCGQKVQDSEESVNNNEATNSSTTQAASQASLPNNPTYNGPIGDVLSAKSWMIIGLILNLITLWISIGGIIIFPPLPILLLIPTIICTLVGMKKVMKLLLEINGDEAKYFYKGIKALNLNYFICILATTIWAIIAIFIMATLPQEYFSYILVLLPILLLYYLGILVWAFVQWINLIKFISKLTR